MLFQPELLCESGCSSVRCQCCPRLPCRCRRASESHWGLWAPPSWCPPPCPRCLPQPWPDLFHRRGLWEASTYVCGQLELPRVAGSYPELARVDSSIPWTSLAMNAHRRNCSCCQKLLRVVCGQTELPKVILAFAAKRPITRIVVIARPTSIPSPSLAMNAHRRNCSCWRKPFRTCCRNNLFRIYVDLYFGWAVSFSFILNLFIFGDLPWIHFHICKKKSFSKCCFKLRILHGWSPLVA